MSIQNATTSAKPSATNVFTTPVPMATTPEALSRANVEAHATRALNASVIHPCTVSFCSTSAYRAYRSLPQFAMVCI